MNIIFRYKFFSPVLNNGWYRLIRDIYYEYPQYCPQGNVFICNTMGDGEVYMTLVKLTGDLDKQSCELVHSIIIFFIELRRIFNKLICWPETKWFKQLSGLKLSPRLGWNLTFHSIFHSPYHCVQWLIILRMDISYIFHYEYMTL